MQAMIKYNILLWAIERAQFNAYALAKKLNVREEKVNQWLSGIEQPTFKQAQNIANILQVPFGYFFLSNPPDETLPIPDLRTINNETNSYISPNFKEMLYDLDRKQRWYREYLVENGTEKLEYIGMFSIEDSKEKVILSMKEKLQWVSGFKSSSNAKDDYITEITKRAENIGIIIMRSSYVGSNTRKSLSIKEFRGLAISDNYAPFIFINTADAKSAQIFTLAHELAHLWIGESGISSLDYLTKQNNSIEKFCNEVAAELLVPQNEFYSQWKSDMDINTNCQNLAKNFHVSSVVILKRAYDLSYIDFSVYKEYYNKFQSEWEEFRLNRDNNGGNYYNTMGVKESKLFSHAIISATLEGKLLFRDAAQLLNIKKISTFKKYAQEMRIF